MPKSWDYMTEREKLENLRQAIFQIQSALNVITSDLDEGWEAMRATRTEVAKITKDVATLRALWPKKYSRTG